MMAAGCYLVWGLLVSPGVVSVAASLSLMAVGFYCVSLIAGCLEKEI